MPDAFVHVIVEPGAVTRAAERIGEMEAISAVHLVTGEYDLIVQVDLDGSDLPTVVAERIHSVSGVVSTTTSVAYEP